jgi:hypothetical protein
MKTTKKGQSCRLAFLIAQVIYQFFKTIDYEPDDWACSQFLNYRSCYNGLNTNTEHKNRMVAVKVTRGMDILELSLKKIKIDTQLSIKRS